MVAANSKYFIETIKRYLKALDNSFDKLSHMYEGNISNLPNYVFNKRHILILKFHNLDYYLIKIYGDKSLLEDTTNIGVISSNFELERFCFPFTFNFDFQNPVKNYGIKITNADIRQVGNINSLPVVDLCVLSIANGKNFTEWFSIEAAKKRALDEWNNKANSLDNNYSFVFNLKKIFDKFELILERDSFVERRLHRFLNSHSLYLLPPHINCFFEVKLHLGDETCIADFILERESGFSPLLIELESSFHKVFKNNHELTFQANHAGEQIRKWVKFIESNSNNFKSNMQFLTGPKERLIVIGRGLEYESAMKDTKFSENKIWTYDLLVKEAKNRWNRIIKDQCKTIGIDKPNLLQ